MPDPQPKVIVEKIEYDGYTVGINAWVNSTFSEETKPEFNERLLNDLKSFIGKPYEVQNYM